MYCLTVPFSIHSEISDGNPLSSRKYPKKARTFGCFRRDHIRISFARSYIWQNRIEFPRSGGLTSTTYLGEIFVLVDIESQSLYGDPDPPTVNQAVDNEDVAITTMCS